MTTGYPPEHPLGSAAAKIERANMHIQNLIASISEDGRKDVSIERKGKLSKAVYGGDTVDSLRIASRDPTLWGLMMGDAVTNLRSALDHITWALAIKHGEPMTPRAQRYISFPLGDDRTKFSVSPLILPAAGSEIERFQPYNRTSWPKLELLGVLDELSRLDKHRVIVVVERLIHLQFNSSQRDLIRQRLDEPYHKWFFVSADDDFQPQSTFDIVTYPDMRGTRGFSSLELGDVHDFIRDEVLPAFAVFFP